jgi:hypothetical protein
MAPVVGDQLFRRNYHALAGHEENHEPKTNCRGQLHAYSFQKSLGLMRLRILPT